MHCHPGFGWNTPASIACYPKDGLAAGYYHHHPDPVVPVYWRIDEIAPSVEQAIARYQDARD